MLKKNIYLAFCTFLLLFLGTSLHNRAFAQFPPNVLQGNNTPKSNSGTPPDSSKVSLPGLDKRIEELRQAGVPEDVIQAYIQQQSTNQGKGSSPTNPNLQPTASDLATGQPSTSPIPGVLSGAGDNPSLLTLYNSKLDRIDTFRTKDEWYKQFLREDKNRKQRNYEDALQNTNTLFGRHIFIKDDFTRSDTASYSPPEDYVVQVGDRFLVQAVGPAEIFEQLVVDKDGTVFRNFMGKKAVGGTTYREARRILESSYRRLLPDDATLLISLVKTKGVISVNVLGEVKEPGTYTLPSVTNALSALFAAKGINDLGSVRNIYVKRDGKTVKVIDLYAYLIEGKMEQVYLKNNDYIYVPMQNAVVQVLGGVKRPMRYEVKSGETVNDVVKFAGGLNYDATKEKAQISRLENGKDIVLDFNLNTEGNKAILDGDVLRIRTSYRQMEAIAQITGAVKYPSTYRWYKGGRVRDLIEMAGGLTKEAYLERAYLIRVTKPGELSYIPVDLRNLDKDTVQNIRVQFLDQLIVFDQMDFTRKRYIAVMGNVNKPGRFDATPSSSMKEILLKAGGPDMYAETRSVELSYFSVRRDDVIRLDETKNYLDFYLVNAPEKTPPVFKLSRDLEAAKEYYFDSLYYQHALNLKKFTRRVDLGENWLSNPTLDTILIGDYQFLTLRSKYDYLTSYSISVEGAITTPQIMQITGKMTVKDVIYAGGGFRKESEVTAIDLYTRYRDIEKGNFGIKTPQKELIRIKIGPDWRNDKTLDSIQIFPFERIIFQDQRNFIEAGYIDVKGLVNNPNQFKYSPKMTLKDALYISGGIKIESDFNKIEISRVLDIENTNGEVLPLSVKTISIAISQDWQNDFRLDSILLLPYDQIFIRPNPDFRLQENVFIEGEVLIPGEYVKRKSDERLSEMIARAGGLTKTAFPEGSYLMRAGYGQIVINLEKALKRPGSKYDLIIRASDRLIVPKLSEIVTIEGNILQVKDPNKISLSPDKEIGNSNNGQNSVNFLYDPSKRRSLYYLGLAGGFERKTRKSQVYVAYPNGEVKKTKNFLLFRVYPQVSPGCVINVPKRIKELNQNGEEQVSLKDRLTEIVAGTTSVLTLVILLRAATK